MKAAVLKSLERFVVEDVPLPDVDVDSVLVRVYACAVCGSDIRMYHYGNPRLKPPAVMGHESAGEVVAAGTTVSKFSVGDRVAIGADVPCGECEFCEDGIGNNCPINYAMGYQFRGSFAEYVLLDRIVVNHGPVHKLPPHVSYDEAALAEPLGCVLNALELTGECLGDTAVVIGAGPIGCMLLEVLGLMGATRRVLVQRSRPRLDIARDMGVADEYVCSSEEDPVARVREITGGLGAEVVLTACPSPDAQIQAVDMAKNRGRVNFFGGLPKDKSRVTLDTNVIHYKELFIMGAHGCVPRHHRRAVELIASGAVDVGKYISHRFALDDIDKAFAAAESHAGMRVVVNP